jgi:hypothetical protein
LTPPDPQLKGAWYPGGFNPRTYQVKTRFQSLLSKCNLCCYGVGFTDAGMEPGNDANKYGRAVMKAWKEDLYARLRGGAVHVDFP